ncbi:MAG: hypothetical protein ACYC91_11115 [Solirubrobacteraceae bacterium]
MQAFAAQFEAGLHPGHANLLQPLGWLLLSTCVGGLIVVVLGQVVRRIRRARQARASGRRLLRAAAAAEVRARALMDELCPHGWRAQVMLFDATELDGASGQIPIRARVALDWTAFEDDSSRVAVVRRVWAPTITEALDAMVADRRTDETLQRIEQNALSDGAFWPDL